MQGGERDYRAATVQLKNRHPYRSVQLIPESQADVLINARRLQITPSLPMGLNLSEIERTKGGEPENVD